MENKIEIYGIAYHSPLVIYNLISPRKHYGILLLDENTKRIKEDFENQKRHSHSANKMPVILAGSLDILHTFLKLYPDLVNVKVILFDFPGLLIPFFGKFISWLDCDHQAGGSWQIAKLKPEMVDSLLNKLNILSKEGREFLLDMKRCSFDANKVNEIEKFAEYLPKVYKDLLAAYTEKENQVKSLNKLAKDERRKKESLKSLILSTVSNIKDEKKKRFILHLALDYQLSSISKREFLSKFNTNINNENLKENVLIIRKWIDSKLGTSLYNAYLDFLANAETRSIDTILKTHKKVDADDLIMLLAKQSRTKEVLNFYKDQLVEYSTLMQDKVLPKKPFYVEIKLEDIFKED